MAITSSNPLLTTGDIKAISRRAWERGLLYNFKVSCLITDPSHVPSIIVEYADHTENYSALITSIRLDADAQPVVNLGFLEDGELALSLWPTFWNLTDTAVWKNLNLAYADDPQLNTASPFWNIIGGYSTIGTPIFPAYDFFAVRTRGVRHTEILPKNTGILFDSSIITSGTVHLTIESQLTDSNMYGEITVAFIERPGEGAA